MRYALYYGIAFAMAVLPLLLIELYWQPDFFSMSWILIWISIIGFALIGVIFGWKVAMDLKTGQEFKFFKIENYN